MNTPLFDAAHGNLHASVLLVAGGSSTWQAQKTIFLGLAVILGLVLIVIVAATIIHKIVNRSDSRYQSMSPGFTLADLRKLHRSGQMTDEEFEAAKALVISQSRKFLRDEAPKQDRTDDQPSAPRNNDNDEREQDPFNRSSDNDPPPR